MVLRSGFVVRRSSGSGFSRTGATNAEAANSSYRPERLFAESFARASTIYRDALAEVRANRLSLANTDFDTGQPTMRGEYPMADETYAELVKRLADRPPAEVPQAMRENITLFYGSPVLATTN